MHLHSFTKDLIPVEKERERFLLKREGKLEVRVPTFCPRDHRGDEMSNKYLFGLGGHIGGEGGRHSINFVSVDLWKGATLSFGHILSHVTQSPGLGASACQVCGHVQTCFTPKSGIVTAVMVAYVFIRERGYHS